MKVIDLKYFVLFLNSMSRVYQRTWQMLIPFQCLTLFFSLTYRVNELWSPSASRMPFPGDQRDLSVFSTTVFSFLVQKTHNKYLMNKFCSKTQSSPVLVAWLECPPVHQEVAGLIPSGGACRRQARACTLSLSLSNQ